MIRIFTQLRVSPRLHYLQPVAFGFCLLQQNLPAVLSPACAGFGDEVSFRRRAHFPEDLASVSDNPGPKPFIF
jgi:hypothetical protein